MKLFVKRSVQCQDVGRRSGGDGDGGCLESEMLTKRASWFEDDSKGWSALMLTWLTR